MGKGLQNRVERLVERLGDPNDTQTRVRGMSDAELNAELRKLMLQGGYDPTLPHDKALAGYIAKLEGELDTLSPEDQGYRRQSLALLKKGPNHLSEIFPESPMHCAQA